MLFNSHGFLFIFLPVALFGFWTLRCRGNAAAQAWLVAVSLAFYSIWHPPHILLLAGSIVFNFTLGGLLAANGGLHWTSWALRLGVAANLGTLGYCKYAGFFAENLAFAGVATSGSFARVGLPLAVSFFTFQQIAYLVDSRNGRIHSGSFLDYALFVCFFPQLISGPIVRCQDVTPQFADLARNATDPDRYARALPWLTIGLFKKVVVADRLAAIADPVFHQAAAACPLTYAEAWLGALAYSYQLYFDFSGYSDMAVGLGLLFGVALPLNFNSPYRARNIADFWRRWHMSLSLFLRDYLYIPLGGKRRGSWRRALNTMITMVLGGLWHGASWTFVAWGALHGAYLLVHRRFADLFPETAESRVRVGMATAVTTLAVVVGWVFFRSADFGAAFRMLKAMLALDEAPVPTILAPYLTSGAHATGLFRHDLVAEVLLSTLLVISAAAATLLLPNTQQLLGRPLPVRVGSTAEGGSADSRWSTLPNRWKYAGLGVVMAFSVLQLAHASQFIYFQF